MSWKLFMLLVKASGLTLAISSISIVIGLGLGFVICAGLLSDTRSLNRAAELFVSFFRGVPLLVQLLLIYHLLPAIGVNISSTASAIVGLSLCTAAYQAENLRAGFTAVPGGLLEAAKMCGFSHFQTFRRIRAPIALRLTLPAIINEAVLLLKASSLVSVVGIVELTRMAQDLASSTYRPIPIFASAGLLYFIICAIVAGIGALYERRQRWARG
jgi:polar amino acid transport system permease protein